MFTAETLRFLRDLSINNSKAWFAENKPRYEAHVNAPAKALAATLAAEVTQQTGVPHREKIFRINRDLRFSQDKTPYNTHIHMAFVPESGPATRPSYMLGLSPEYFALGCGAMGFDKAGLAAFRERAAGPEGDRIVQLLVDLEAEGVRIPPPELKRVPAPFGADHPRGALLRRKSLMGWRDGAKPEEGLGPDLTARAMEGFVRLRPLHDQLMAT
ncbi:uncharacterized protein (TIGR02453 family) [Aliiruegeria haliotis]|uniref:Uncharacterized protein (TIGR02453 family) n=1 Tax=Aliiruegeria haliotis TaxID=1280846 RepID=A0A2T0RZP3_9RHOB|nr:TIGR02453 family protein [Aliiruegeria haliotis]PRY26592.1 uncharacterized protein (TIGR02453 family) [Aliiruegeria haliotis]